jgi:hypothetical protein
VPFADCVAPRVADVASMLTINPHTRALVIRAGVGIENTSDPLAGRVSA